MTLTLNGAGKGHNSFLETFLTQMGPETARIWNHLYVQFLLEPLKCYYCRLWKLFSGKLTTGAFFFFKGTHIKLTTVFK